MAVTETYLKRGGKRTGKVVGDRPIVISVNFRQEYVNSSERLAEGGVNHIFHSVSCNCKWGAGGLPLRRTKVGGKEGLLYFGC